MRRRNKPLLALFASYLLCNGLAFAKSETNEKSSKAQTHKAAPNEAQALSVELLLFIAELSDVDGQLVSPLDLTNEPDAQAKMNTTNKQMKQTKASKTDPQKVESNEHD